MSVLSLEKNGRVFSSKQTKNIKVIHYLIKDYHDAGEIDVKFCPTDGMWADVLTKPLQGQKFRDMRAFLQNFPRDYDDDTEQNNLMNPQDIATLQECVGKCAKNAIGKGKRNKSPCCVLWADETRALSRKKTRQGPTPHHANMPFEYIQKQNHVAKPRGQKIQKIQETPPRGKKICSHGQKICKEQGQGQTSNMDSGDISADDMMLGYILTKSAIMGHAHTVGLLKCTCPPKNSRGR
jgi:hypothetical protein